MVMQSVAETGRRASTARRARQAAPLRQIRRGKEAVMAAHPEVEQSLAYLRDITARLRQEWIALPAAAWDAPSSCPPWTVRRLAAHLVENALFIEENVACGVAGDT